MRSVLTTVVAAAALAAGCGGTAARESVGAVPAAGLPDSAVAAMHLDRARARQVGSFDGRGIWIAPTLAGETCLLETYVDAVGGSCGPTLFGAHQLAFTEATDGGPSPRPLTSARITGVAAAGIASVAVELSDGSRAVVEPGPEGVFGYDEPAALVAAGVLPAALDARSTAKQVDRIDLPRQFPAR